MIELAIAGLFVAVNLVAPFTLGERYPFTVAPMFRDQPGEYCLYVVRDSDGTEIDPRELGLHLVYDGNPPGLGVGIKPPPTLHEFGVVPSELELAEWIQPWLAATGRDRVIVQQTIVRPNGRRLSEEKREWLIGRESVE